MNIELDFIYYIIFYIYILYWIKINIITKKVQVYVYIYKLFINYEYWIRFYIYILYWIKINIIKKKYKYMFIFL